METPMRYQPLYVDELMYIVRYYEPSKLNIYELVRTFHPVDFAAFLFLVENSVRRGKKRKLKRRGDAIDDNPLNPDNYRDPEENIILAEREETGRFRNLIKSGEVEESYSDDDTNPLDLQLAEESAKQMQVILRECEKPNLYMCYNDRLRERGINCEQEVFSNGVTLDDHGLSDERCGFPVYDPSQAHSFKPRINKRLTIIGVLKYFNKIQNNAIELSELEMKCINNFKTDVYDPIFISVKNWILPGDLTHTNRNMRTYYDTHAMKSTSEQFLAYMKGEFVNLNPETFNMVPIKRSTRIHDIHQIPKYSHAAYYKQPLFNGLHVVINFNDTNTTKFYNIHGELLGKFQQKFNVKCTLECVLLHKSGASAVLPRVFTDTTSDISIDDRKITYKPITAEKSRLREPMKQSELMSWRYFLANSILTHKYHIVVLDCLRYKHKLLLNLPYIQRLEYVKRIVGPNCSVVESFENESDVMAIYYDVYKCKLYPVITGIVFKHKGHTYNKQTESKSIVYHLNFPLITIFNALTQEYAYLSKREQKLSYHFQYYFNLNMIKLREAVIAYYHNDEYMCLCYFNRHYKQFIHLCVISVEKISLPPFTYKKPFFVRNGLKSTMGYAILRLYYNDFNELDTVVAIDTKRTLSMHDVPFTSRLVKRYLTSK